MKKILKKIICLSLLLCMFFVCPIYANQDEIIDITEVNTSKNKMINVKNIKKASASPGNIVEHIKNKTFYIKNAYSGRYLDVEGGETTNGTNVQQYEYNGTNSQRWYIKYNNEGTFTFYSKLKNDFVLDIGGGGTEDFTNVQAYEYNGTSAQRFKLMYSSTSTYAIASKTSDFKKGIVVKDSRLQK